MLSSIHAVCGQMLLLRLAVVPVFLSYFKYFQSTQSPTFIQKFLNKFLCSVTFKNFVVHR